MLASSAGGTFDTLMCWLSFAIGRLLNLTWPDGIGIHHRLNFCWAKLILFESLGPVPGGSYIGMASFVNWLTTQRPMEFLMERFSQIGLQAWSWNFWGRRARGKSFGQAHWIAIAFFYPCRCWTQHRIFGFRGFKSIRTPLSVLWPVSGFWQEDTARKWWAATNISVFQSKGPRPMKRRWSMRRPIVTLSNLGLFLQQASYYDDVDCNWLCELNLQWLLPWSHFWLKVLMTFFNVEHACQLMLERQLLLLYCCFSFLLFTGAY